MDGYFEGKYREEGKKGWNNMRRKGIYERETTLEVIDSQPGP